MFVCLFVVCLAAFWLLLFCSLVVVGSLVVCVMACLFVCLFVCMFLCMFFVFGRLLIIFCASLR